MTFKTLGLSNDLLKALQEMGFETPTQVQAKAIPAVLKQNDLIVKSKTGSGKTAAFGLPILQQIDPAIKHPQALVLTPTRELAVQVDEDFKQFSKYLKLTCVPVYGQHNIQVEITQLKQQVHVVTGTPGRVYDHLQEGTFKTDQIKYLVLDEADKMLDMGFIDQVKRIIKRLPKDRVTLLFSATMPTIIQNICWEYMKNPETISIASDTKTVDAITQWHYKVQHHEKRTQLNRIITVEAPDSCIVFCNTRIGVDRVKQFLEHKGFHAHALHGAISQSRRLKTINQFKNGDFNFLVATDVAARGIHVDDVSHVINYDVPLEHDSYVHRIGRTGRAGSGGKAITLVTGEDLMSFYEIEEHIGAMIEERDLPSDQEVADHSQTTRHKLKRKTPQRLAVEKANAESDRPSGQQAKPTKDKGQKRPGKNKAKTPTKRVAKPVRHPEPQKQKPETKVSKSANQGPQRPLKKASPVKPEVHPKVPQRPIEKPTVESQKRVRSYSEDEVAKVIERMKAPKRKEDAKGGLFKKILKKLRP